MEPSVDPRAGSQDAPPRRPDRTVGLAEAGLDRIDRRLADLERQIAELRSELSDLSTTLERAARR